jgi:hypothetical protein
MVAFLHSRASVLCVDGVLWSHHLFYDAQFGRRMDRQTRGKMFVYINIYTHTNTYRSRYSDGLDGPGSYLGSARFLSSPRRPDWLWGPLGLLCNGYRE